MPTATTYALIANILKIQYPEGLEPMLFEESDIAKWIPKDPSYEGASRQYNPLIDGNYGSNTFAAALQNRRSPTLPRFNVTHVHRWGIGSIDDEAVKASRSKKGALAEALKLQVDSVLYGFSRALAHQIVGNGGGARCRGDAAWNVATPALQILNQRDQVYLENGMVLQASTDNGTGGAGVKPGTIEISAINRDTGAVTLTGNANAGIPTIVNTDWLFLDGEYGNCLSGIQAWVPAVAPGAGLFFGVNRTVDLTRLSGTRSTTSGPIEEQINHMLTRLYENGGKADTIWLHPRRGAELQNSIHGKTWFEAVKSAATNMNGRSSATIFYPGFVFQGPKGAVTCHTDPCWPFEFAWACRKEDWELFSMGEAPAFATQGGDKFFVEQLAPAKQFRMDAYWQVGCKRLVNNAMHTFA